MTATAIPSSPGAFLHSIEFCSDRPAEIQNIIDRWLTAIGSGRTVLGN
jgi:hypothetical protein